MIARKRIWAGVGLVLIVLGVASLLIPVTRRAILRAAGWALVVNDPLEPADVIVIAVDADGAGALEATDLVRDDVAKRVAVFADPPDATVNNEFMRRGIPYEWGAEQTVRELRALGVNAVEFIPGYVAGSEDEGPALANWCDHHGFRSVVVVTTPDHSRRLHRVLRRSMNAHQARVVVRCAHYSMFDPDRWWASHGGIRTEIEELEKLLLDVVRHPSL
jgi:hypothetical protein